MRQLYDVEPSVQDYSRLSLHEWIAGLVITDLVGAIALAMLVFGTYADPLNYDRGQLWAGASAMCLAWILAAHSQKLYHRETVLNNRASVLRAVATWALAFGLVLLLGFGLKLIGGVSRLWLSAWALTTLIWVITARLAWRWCLKIQVRNGRCLDRALIVASSASMAREFGTMLETATGGRFRAAATMSLPGLPNAPPLSWVETAIRRGAIDRVFITGFDDAPAQTNAVVTRLMRLAVDITLVPKFEGLQVPLLRVGSVGGLPTVDVATHPLSPIQAMTKRAEDVVLASIGILAALPVFVLIAIAIKLDSPGPVFFRQQRAGFHDRCFKVWKFRTMHHAMRDEGAVVQTARNDARVTRVGRILRQTSLDELPQLLNVLCGEMSIVGPRPHALGMKTAGQPLQEIHDSYAARHRIRPGITGWAQINGSRGEVDTEEKLRHRVALDCYYIENWSLAFDLWIILRTCVMLAFDRNAY